jgi:hypothetical protein
VKPKMSLQLLITKIEIKHYNTKTKIQYRFAVIDLDKAKQYPQNFVCLLPKTIKEHPKPTYIFEKLYGTQSTKIAKQLLKEALKTEPDPEITKAIIYRLKLLEPIPKPLVKCNMCGKDFQARKYIYGRQKNLQRMQNQKIQKKSSINYSKFSWIESDLRSQKLLCLY